MIDIFEAASDGDVEAVAAALAAGANPAALGPEGFTALQLAAMASNGMDVARNVAVLRLLVDAGSPLEFTGPDGRSALFLAAEFAPETDAVALLLDAGAVADVYDSHGNHVVDNAMMESVQELLTTLTGRQPRPPVEEPAPRKMTAAQWHAAKVRIDAVFASLEQAGLIALQDAGVTQSDGFADCSEAFHARGGADVRGFCFYTRQDLNRAKRTSQLSLGFWGAPDGAWPDMVRVGTLIAETCAEAGLPVIWNGSAGMRPSIDLRATAA